MGFLSTVNHLYIVLVLSTTKGHVGYSYISDGSTHRCHYKYTIHLMPETSSWAGNHIYHFRLCLPYYIHITTQLLGGIEDCWGSDEWLIFK